MGGLVGGVVSSVGGLISGGKAADAAKGQAEALRNAGNQAYNYAKFNPVGITTNFGKSQFDTGANGRITSAGYTLSPQLQAIQNNLLNTAGSYNPAAIGEAAQPLMGGASQLFNLGSQYLAQNPQDVAQNWLTKQQNLLAPSREQDLANVQNQQYQTGRAGLAVGGTSQGYGGAGSPGLMATNPQLAALYNARAQQDAQLAAQAQQQGQQQLQFGAGLFGTGGNMLAQLPALTSAGYSPLQTQLGLANTVEQFGQQPFALSQNLASAESGANANAAQLYMQPQQAAANAYAQYQGYSPMGTFMQGIGNSIANWQGGGTQNPYSGGLFNSNNSNYFGGSGGGWVPQSDSNQSAGLFSGSSAYNQNAGWSA